MRKKKKSLLLIIFASREKLFLTLGENKAVFLAQKISPLADNFLEVFFHQLDFFLKENSCQIENIEKIYAGIGPGSYLINRAIVTFLKTSKILNCNLKIFTINNLLFQIGKEKKIISLIDANKKNFYLMISDQPKEKSILWKKTALAQLKDQYPSYAIYQNLLDFDHWQHFTVTNKQFHLVTNWKKIFPIEL